jgi:hypothetical protein
VTQSRRDIRDKRTHAVQVFVDRAFDDAEQRPDIAHRLFGDEPVGPPPGNWPAPTVANRERANAEARAAALAARAWLRTLGTTHLYTTRPELPQVRVAWHPLRPEQATPPAPLVHSLIEERGKRMLAKLAAFTHTRHTKPLFDENVRRNQLHRLNAFAELEVSLWWLAASGGYEDPPPYAVRYELVRWLWHPTISGVIFCLRCGTELRYERAERGQASRTARCRACSRGREDDWPNHAVEPHRRGTWLLHCMHLGCDELFVGRRQAQHCERHRLNRLSPGIRSITS